MTAITDAEGNDYSVTYEGEKAVRFTKPDGEYQQITYGDGTTTVSLHKSDGTKISEDSMTYEKKSGKLLSSTNENGIKTTYQYENAENPLDVYKRQPISTEASYSEITVAGFEVVF